tara:strand:+ start:149 stop:490 length:342 start_codon:yes stop_codon:yes gene_type:complete
MMLEKPLRAGHPSSECVAIASADTDQTVVTCGTDRIVVLEGAILSNGNASAAVFDVYDGASASSDLLFSMSVPANDSKELGSDFFNGGHVATTSIVARSDQTTCKISISFMES